MTTNYEFLQTLSSNILKTDNSILWIGIINRFGVLLNTELKKGLEPLLTEEENEDYAATVILRHKTRYKFEPKIGRLIYALGRYEKFNRVTIPINQDYYLLIIIDKNEKNFDIIIMNKVIPIIENSKQSFAGID